MSIEWLRDLVIIIFGVVATIVSVILALVLLSFYRQMKSIEETRDAILAAAKSISQVGSEVIAPLLRSSIVFQVISQVAELVMSMFEKRREKNE